MRIVGLLFAASLAALVMLGCSRSEGQLGHASFAWQECLGGCSVTDNPMAAGGASAEISVSLANGYSFTQVRSSNPSVATFSLGGSNGLDIVAVSGAPGQAQLELLDGSGKLVDEVTVTSTATAKLALTQGWMGAAPLVLENTFQTFHVTTEDANGHTLVGTGSVVFDMSGSVHSLGGLTFGDSIDFSGQAGAGTITASAPSAKLTQPISVVPLAAITRLSATVRPNTSDASGTYANVDVSASTQDGNVYGVHCGWGVPAGTGIVFQSETTSSLESPATATAKFLLGQPGTYSVTCTVGAVSTSVQLTR